MSEFWSWVLLIIVASPFSLFIAIPWMSWHADHEERKFQAYLAQQKAAAEKKKADERAEMERRSDLYRRYQEALEVLGVDDDDCRACVLHQTHDHQVPSEEKQLRLIELARHRERRYEPWVRANVV